MGRPLSVRLRKTLKRLRPQKEPEPVSVADQMAGPGREQSIPRVVYQTAESRSVHPTHAKSIAEFRGLNPDLAFQMFDVAERDQYMTQHWAHHPIFDIYQRAVFAQMKADIFRYCIIYENGGYYIDYNKGATTPLTQLHEPQAEAWLCLTGDVASICPSQELLLQNPEAVHFFAHEYFGFPPGHPVLHAVIDGIVFNSRFFDGKKCWSAHRAVHTLTGGGALTEAVRPWMEKHGTHWDCGHTEAENLFQTLWSDYDCLLLRIASGAQDTVILGVPRAEKGVDTNGVAASHGTTPNATAARRKTLHMPRPRQTTAVLHDQMSDHPFAGAIPARLVQTTPSRTILQSHFTQIQRFRLINSDLNHLVFDEGEVNKYMTTAWGSHPIFDVFTRSQFGPMKADIFRYCQIFDEGGFYIDITKAVWTRLSSFASHDSEAVISFDKNECGQMAGPDIADLLLYPENQASQWCFGFSPRHQILESAINRIVELAPFFEDRKFRSVRQAVFALTGPGLFTWAVREFFQNRDTDRIAQAERFFGEPGFLERLDPENFAFQGAKHYASQNNVEILAARVSS